jgi:hypothetical protein
MYALPINLCLFKGDEYCTKSTPTHAGRFFFILQVWFVFIPRAKRHVSISGALQEASIACHARWTHVSQDDSFISSVRILFSWHIRLPFWYLLLGKKYTSNNKFGGNNFIKLMCRPKKITPIIIRIRLDEE